MTQPVDFFNGPLKRGRWRANDLHFNKILDDRRLRTRLECEPLCGSAGNSFGEDWGELVCMAVMSLARSMRRNWWALGVAGALLLLTVGCGGSVSTPLPDVEGRMAQLFHLYQAYVQKNQKGPPNEEALKEFGKKLTNEERANYAIGNDLESIWVSPRDNKKFEVNYNVKIDPAQNRLVIWESTSQNGVRYVALTFGYVVAQDDETFKGQKK